jgi:hypothetical protein
MGWPGLPACLPLPSGLPCGGKDSVHRKGIEHAILRREGRIVPHPSAPPLVSYSDANSQMCCCPTGSVSAPEHSWGVSFAAVNMDTLIPSCDVFTFLYFGMDSGHWHTLMALAHSHGSGTTSWYWHNIMVLAHSHGTHTFMAMTHSWHWHSLVALVHGTGTASWHSAFLALALPRGVGTPSWHWHALMTMTHSWHRHSLVALAHPHGTGTPSRQ